jgi:hypothetical protein
MEAITGMSNFELGYTIVGWGIVAIFSTYILLFLHTLVIITEGLLSCLLGLGSKEGKGTKGDTNWTVIGLISISILFGVSYAIRELGIFGQYIY